MDRAKLNCIFHLSDFSEASEVAFTQRVRIEIQCANQYGEDKLVGEAVVALA